MSRATFEIDAALRTFLAREQRDGAVTVECARAATLKQAIEALGVPHTEIGRLLVNGTPATLSRTVREGDHVEVFAHEPGAAPFEAPLAFIADAHLGGLAHMLRMLGFDTLYDQNFQDRAVVDLGQSEHRVVLTRDRELLKCRDVLRGCYVHALKAEAQLREVAARYPIARQMRPFTLCLHCNAALKPATAEAIIQQVPARIQARYSTFMCCPECRRVYWEGSHWERMRNVLAATLDVPVAEVRSRV
ncbi:MAG TPA: Mut7-C RNAse domain-containing protein [Burkholderiales bacterium]|nr:Mut7-C RNAse domain-containing protein [Burkholderiales bacterium]